MPIEIKELHILVTVNTSPNSRTTTAAADGDEKEAIVAECVEQVLQILQTKAER
jgi:hypothetical protein